MSICTGSPSSANHWPPRHRNSAASSQPETAIRIFRPRDQSRMPSHSLPVHDEILIRVIATVVRFRVYLSHRGSTSAVTGISYPLLSVLLFLPVSGLMLRARFRLAREDAQIHRVRHGLVAGVVGVQVIAGVELGAYALRILGVPRGGFEIHHGIVGTARSYPGIQSLAHGFARVPRIARALVGCQRATDHPDAVGMRLLD